MKPLPTEPYTVIRARFPDGGERTYVKYVTGWQGKDGSGLDESRITGFEVLARPVEGVTLTPEEATLTLAILHTHAIEYAEQKAARMEALSRALAARLEGS